jgi:hypothetical protein
LSSTSSSCAPATSRGSRSPAVARRVRSLARRAGMSGATQDRLAARARPTWRRQRTGSAPARDLASEPRLSTAASARERHQPCRADKLHERVDLVGSADEWSERERNVRQHAWDQRDVSASDEEQRPGKVKTRSRRRPCFRGIYVRRRRAHRRAHEGSPAPDAGVISRRRSSQYRIGTTIMVSSVAPRRRS